MTLAERHAGSRILAVAQQKGGTGKTSTSVNLGAALAARGRTVLLIDVDPQASASAWLGGSAPEPPFLEQVLAGDVPACAAIRPTACPGLSLLPASLALAVQERRMAGEIGAEQVLAERLAELSGFDFILLDGPPELGLLAFNALAAAREVLVPVLPEPLSLRGLDQLLGTLATVRRRVNPRLALLGILPFRVPSRTRLAREMLAGLRENHGADLLACSIREATAGAGAPALGLPLCLAFPHATVTQDYEHLADEILARSC